MRAVSAPLVLESLVPTLSPDAAIVGAVPVPYGVLGLLRAVALAGAEVRGEPERLQAAEGGEAIVAALGAGVLLVGAPGGLAQLCTASAVAELVFGLERLRGELDLGEAGVAADSAEARWVRGERADDGARRVGLGRPLWEAVAAGAALHVAVAASVGPGGAGGGAGDADARAALERIEAGLPAEELARAAEALARLGAGAAAETVRVARRAASAARGAGAGAGETTRRAERARALGLAALEGVGAADRAETLAALDAALEAGDADAELKAALARACVRAGGAERLGEACLLAAELWMAGEGARAGDVLARAWEARAKEAPAAPGQLEALRAAWKNGDHAKVAVLGEALLAKPCWEPDVHIRMALALVFLERAADAADGLERYVAARPDDARGWENLVTARVLAARRAGDHAAIAASVGTAAAAARVHPRSVPVLLNAVEAHREAGLFREALALARRAAALAPGEPRVTAVVERALAHVADRPSAGADPEADYDIGAARLNVGDARGAIPFLLAASAHAPDHPLAGSALGQAFLLAGDARQAIGALEEFVKQNPNDAHACGILALARLALYAPEPPELVTRRARRELERALGRSPDVAEFHLGLARCLELEGDAAGERRALERAAALGSAEARKRLGAARPERG